MTIAANGFYIEHYIVRCNGEDASIPQLPTWGCKPFSTE